VDKLIEKASAMQKDCEAHVSAQPPASKPKVSKNSAMIFGSSIVRHIRGSNIWDSSRVSAKSNCYPGVGVAEIHEHINIKLKYNNLPQTIIVHGGGNDLANNHSVEDITAQMKILCKDLKSKGIVNIAVSGLTPRYLLKDEVFSLNNSLRAMCKENGFFFINNSFITYNYHLSWDKIHLNYDGVDQLEVNYSKYLRKLMWDKK